MSLASLTSHPFVDPGVSRRRFLQLSAATGVFLGTGVFPKMAEAVGPPSGEPQPIAPGIVVAGVPFHLWLPEPPPASNDQSSITDFNGSLGVAVAGGRGVGDFGSGDEDLFWHADIRLMDGSYVDEAGRHRRAKVGFF